MSRSKPAGRKLGAAVGEQVLRFVELLRHPVEGWREAGLCAQTDAEAFFPEKGGSTRDAKRVCQGCEVRLECLAEAIQGRLRFGVWGGLSERERRPLLEALDMTWAPSAPGPATADAAAVDVEPERAELESTRERDEEVLRLTGAGMSAVEIAEELGIAARSVTRSRTRARARRERESAA